MCDDVIMVMITTFIEYCFALTFKKSCKIESALISILSQQSGFPRGSDMRHPLTYRSTEMFTFALLSIID